MVRIYTKLPLSITDQVALLKSRGLQFVDEVAAEKLLSEVCYFRFVQYLRPMEADKIVHSFKPNSKFEDAVALYDFDTQLRSLMFEAIQRIEIALRTKVNHEFSMRHGAFWFYDTSLADDEHKFIENMNAIDRELQRSKEDFIKEHKQKYDRPDGSGSSRAREFHPHPLTEPCVKVSPHTALHTQLFVHRHNLGV